MRSHWVFFSIPYGLYLSLADGNLTKCVRTIFPSMSVPRRVRESVDFDIVIDMRVPKPCLFSNSVRVAL